MSNKIYIGDSNNIARNVPKAYIGDSNNVARKIKKGYIGDSNNVARLFYQALPYTPVNYLKSTRTQYIDTGIKPYKTKTEITFKHITPSTLPSYGNDVYSACWNANDNRYIPLTIDYNSKNCSCLDKANTQIIYQYDIDENIHTIVYNNENNKVLFDNTIKGTISDLSVQATNNLYLFCYNTSTGAGQFRRLYYL